MTIRPFSLFAVLVFAFALTTHAQSPKSTPAPAKATQAPAPKATASPAKPVDRKTLTFQPGAKQPDQAATATPSPAAVPAAAAVRKSTGDQCLDLAGAFFDSLKRNAIDEAYANLTKGSKIGDRPEELRNLKSKTSEAITLFGDINGFEIIENKAVGTTLRRYTIVSFGRDFPLRWRFYFYKVDSQWRLIDLHVDDRLNSIFAEDVDVPGEPKQ